MRTFPIRLYNRIILWWNNDGGGSEGSGGSEEVLLSEEEECRVVRKLLSQNIGMEFILEMKEAFQTFDKNGDEVISGKEIVDLVRCLGHNPTEAELLEIMAQGKVNNHI